MHVVVRFRAERPALVQSDADLVNSHRRASVGYGNRIFTHRSNCPVVDAFEGQRIGQFIGKRLTCMVCAVVRAASRRAIINFARADQPLGVGDPVRGCYGHPMWR